MSRMLHILGSLEVGGAELTTLELCRALDLYDHDVFLVSGVPGALAEKFRAAGVRVHLGHHRRALSLIRLSVVLRTTRPDVVVSHLSLASAWFLLLARRAGVSNRIARLHSTGDGVLDSVGRRLYRFLSRRMMIRTATILAGVSGATVKFATEGVTRKNRLPAIIIPNGVDTNRYAYSTSRGTTGHLRLIHVGRSGPEKNRAALVPIHKALRSRVSSQLLVVGAGPYDDLGQLTEGVEILGVRDDLPALLGGADVLVLPSLREGLPGVILESLAVGTPVVASKLPTIEELCSQLSGITLVSPEASPDEWASAILRARQDAENNRLQIRLSLENSRYTMANSVHEWRKIVD